MSTDTPVILVAQGQKYPTPAQLELIRFYDHQTPLPLVLLRDSAATPPPHDVEFDSVITNTGEKDPYVFRQNATDIITEHSNMVPIAVIELDERWERTWRLPTLRTNY